MNTIDKKAVMIVFGVSAAAYLYMTNKPVKLLGMDEANSKKFVGAVTLIAAGVLVYKTIKKGAVA
jgi:hypothetical protein